MRLKFDMQKLADIIGQYKQIVAVYLFGSSLDEKVLEPRDVDLALLFNSPPQSNVDLYVALYPALLKVFAPLEVDLLFMHSVGLPLCFEIISTGKVIYCADADRRTDFEDNITREYLDFKYHLEIARREYYEEIMEGNLFV
ncbi:type VII toxin-antitoxin system MntA family adenylyltransferase antitoxin [Desulfoscipio gibsoniae]|uniref:Nucleotidyltransferase family protein n=1 Tax=Desulfoscipio gibsoniae DSM 7213 TaxID=767817 RepID=R4KRB5_9FIRM|nr:nucleotidyltransferase domain-containing protein [Desulfoscipio gibsoniae]AGL02156.1 nucleotidyltransferase family protein [Desulfoscipio gibsoniae DSM 7213]